MYCYEARHVDIDHEGVVTYRDSKENIDDAYRAAEILRKHIPNVVSSKDTKMFDRYIISKFSGGVLLSDLREISMPDTFWLTILRGIGDFLSAMEKIKASHNDFTDKEIICDMNGRIHVLVPRYFCSPAQVSNIVRSANSKTRKYHQWNVKIKRGADAVSFLFSLLVFHRDLPQWLFDFCRSAKSYHGKNNDHFRAAELIKFCNSVQKQCKEHSIFTK